MNDIDAQQQDLHRRMEENMDSGGSEEEFNAMVAADEALTAAKAGARGLANTTEAKSVSARIQETRAALDELKATPPAGDQEKFHRMMAIQEATQTLAALEFQAPFAGRPDASLATEREESQIAAEEATEALKTLPPGSARRRREEAHRNEARDRAARLATELNRRREESSRTEFRESVIARRALREATDAYHNLQVKEAREELKKLESAGSRASWYELTAAKGKLQEAHLSPVPPEFVEAKAREIASSPEFQ